MPAMKDVPNVVRIDFQFTINGIPATTRMFFRYATTAGTFGTPSCVATNAAARASINTGFKPIWPTSVNCNNIKTTDLSSHLGAWAQDGVSSVGTRAGVACPANAAVQVNFQINNRYRGGKPRGFWPGGISTDLQDAQHWSNTYAGLYQTAFNNLVTAIVGAAVTPALLSQTAVHWFKGHTPNPNPTVWGPINVPTQLLTPTTDDVVVGSVMQLIGSQRGRLRS
jgi:hypothetical protein